MKDMEDFMYITVWNSIAYLMKRTGDTDKSFLVGRRVKIFLIGWRVLFDRAERSS